MSWQASRGSYQSLGLLCMQCRYSDYVRTESGLQYQDLREGTGKSPRKGAQVTVDWDGYTIGEGFS